MTQYNFKFLYIFIVSMIGSHALYSQAFRYFENEMSVNKNVVGFDLNQRFGSNSLTSGFVLDFLNGKQISDSRKDDCIANFINNELLVGEQINFGLNFKKKLGESNNFLFFELGESYYYESVLHPDIFVLIFKGNKGFEDKSAMLNPFQIKSVQYVYFKTGFHRNTEKYNLKFNIAYTGGQRFLDLKTTRGSLYTAPDGRYIDLDMKLESFDVNPKNRTLFDLSGSGLMTDFIFNYDISRNSTIGFGIEGLGYINWNKNITKRNVDTIYHYDGTEVANVLDSFSIAVKNIEDLKSSFIKVNQVDNRKLSLPYLVYLQFSQFFLPDIFQFQMRYGIINSESTRHYINSAFNFYLNRSSLLGLNVDIGGFGKVNIGAQFAICFEKSSSIHLYFNSISNLMIPSGQMSFTAGMAYRKAMF